MKVFLSYAYGLSDAPIAARLRAVAAAYDISILLPDRTQPVTYLTHDTIQKINGSDAVIALITYTAPVAARNLVSLELQYAIQISKPIIPLVEEGIAVTGVPDNQVVYFNRLNPIAHEATLMAVLEHIRQQQQSKKDLTALGWIAGIALGLLVLNELSSDKK
jgi:nucleoside 2-deoxyribosyltransferase